MARWWSEANEGEQALDSMPIGLMVVSDDWVVRYLNETGAATVGYTTEELVGRSYWEAFPANVGNEFGRVFREVMATGRPQTVEAFYPEPLDQWFEVRAVRTTLGLALYFSEVSARRRTQDRLALLARISAALSRTLDAPAAVTDIPQLVVPALGGWSVLTLLSDDGSLRAAGSWHVNPAARPSLQHWSSAALQTPSSSAPWWQALQSGPVTLIGPEVTDAFAGAKDAHPARELLKTLGTDQFTVFPVRGRGRVLGALVIGHDRQRPALDEDLATAADVADRAGLALDNARLYDQQRRLAEELQRSMLTAPPEPDHAQLVVRYLPAAEAARVGGDWYDAFIQPRGATNLVIGDVVGHDTAAAAAMGQLRSLLRGIAVTGDPGPAEILTTLDVAITQLQLNTYATAAIARFEQEPAEIAAGTTRMRWANAGHPPPLIIDPDGTVRELGTPRGQLMLGVNHRTERTESVVTLGRGATVLLYTDGLIERRDRDLEEGLARLHAAARQYASAPLDELCDKLLEQLVEGKPDDDVALVAIRLHRQDRPRPVEAGPQRVPPTVSPPLTP